MHNRSKGYVVFMKTEHVENFCIVFFSFGFEDILIFRKCFIRKISELGCYDLKLFPQEV